MSSIISGKPQGSQPAVDEKPIAKFFSLKTPYMRQGRMTPVVAKTKHLNIQVKVNAEGGENEIHTHLLEDHAFIVLEGEASIFDETGKETKLKQYQGVMLPAGAYYRYLSTGTQNLVMLRVGAGEKTKGRVNTGGVEFHGGKENKELPPIVMEGKFFAESAGD